MGTEELTEGVVVVVDRLPAALAPPAVPSRRDPLPCHARGDPNLNPNPSEGICWVSQSWARLGGLGGAREGLGSAREGSATG